MNALPGYVATFNIDGRDVRPGDNPWGLARYRSMRKAYRALPKLCTRERNESAAHDIWLAGGSDRRRRAFSAEALALTGKVLDAQSGKPIAGAIVTADKRVALTSRTACFIDAAAARGAAIGVRAVSLPHQPAAAGAGRKPMPSLQQAPLTVKLDPLRPKALYLSFYGIGSRQLRNAALDLIDQTELNAPGGRRQGRPRHDPVQRQGRPVGEIGASA